ncbi:MAG: hypothetical protein ACXAEU_15625 [Candidatus Hodarchaeales archaeon]|jgi:hypothetical protein
MIAKELLTSLINECIVKHKESEQPKRLILFTDIRESDKTLKVFYVDVDQYFRYEIVDQTLSLVHRFYQENRSVFLYDLIDLTHIVGVRLIVNTSDNSD